MNVPRPDDMGDDEQETDERLYERYIDDPPEDLVIESERGGETGIEDYVAMERRPAETERDDDPDPDDPETGGMHVTDEP